MGYRRDNKVIMVIDDMPHMRTVLKSELMQIGFTNIVAKANGHEAINYLTEHHVDLVICDLIMPQMDGEELLILIRKSPTLQHLPFILLTGEEDRVLLERVVKKGVHGLLNKPFNQLQLNQAVDTIFDPESELRVKNKAKLHELLSFIEMPAEHLSLKPNVLVLDDNPAHITQLVAGLEGDYDIKVAKSAENALKILKKGMLIDLMIVDVNMPKINGLQWIEYIKTKTVFSSIPVVFVSGVKDNQTINKAYTLGCVDYVTKPVNTHVLRAKVATHLNYQQQITRLKNQLEMLHMQIETSKTMQNNQHD